MVVVTCGWMEQTVDADGVQLVDLVREQRPVCHGKQRLGQRLGEHVQLAARAARKNDDLDACLQV